MIWEVGSKIRWLLASIETWAVYRNAFNKCK